MVDSRALKVEWSPPSDADKGVVTNYKVNYTKVEQEDDVDSVVRDVTLGADERSYVIKGLEEWTEYRISVQAGSAVGTGPASTIVLRTDESGMFSGLFVFCFLLLLAA